MDQEWVLVVLVQGHDEVAIKPERPIEDQEDADDYALEYANKYIFDEQVSCKSEMLDSLDVMDWIICLPVKRVEDL